jgi:hypothetical protein
LHEILTDEEIKEFETKLEALKEEVQKERKDKSYCKDALQKFKDAWGCPIESVIAHIGKVIAKLGVTRERYHGGDFNGVSIRAIVRNIVDIMPFVREILMREKYPSCSGEEATRKLDRFLLICGLVDATFSTLLSMDHAEAEILDTETKLHNLLSVWRAQEMSITLKAHIWEHHMIDNMLEIGGSATKMSPSSSSYINMEREM